MFIYSYYGRPLPRGYEMGVACSTIHNMSGGLTAAGHASRLLHYGPNDIDVPVKPYHTLFVDEVLHPFYIFQVGGV